jgi:predicted Zn-dependent protease
MITMLQRMDQRLGSAGGPGFARTHPSAQARIEAVGPLISNAEAAPDAIRQQRFATAMQSILPGK